MSTFTDRTSRLPFSRAAIVRLVSDLLAAELGRSRGRSSAMLGRSGWDASTSLDEAGLDLDSLERLDASAALNEFFHLHEYGAEDHLLTLPRLGDWCDLVAESLSKGGTHLTFRTSGSTGAAKRCTHPIADLAAEMEGWVDILGPIRRIVSLVPSHHIYGTLFTAMLPDHLGVELLRAHDNVALLRRAGPGTLVVATPTMWSHVARTCPTFPTGMTGISSTAPMPPALAGQLAAQGLDRLVEIYGASEIGGIGFRTAPGDPFVLLDRWRRLSDDAVVRDGADGPVRQELMDRSAWIDARRFHLNGRLDGAVQVGGTNVFPSLVRETLLAHAGVADAAVRIEPVSGRLKAFIIPKPDVSGDTLLGQVDGWCGQRLRDVERPRRFTLGHELPRDPMGKLADWPV
ncbi:4-coumarate--CoA ligase [uncultured Sphingomonas sp.]|uniref:4-coumarate--CoA ligase n=1 Tax=uncultured Sphingomonas sp. TaxID=158754 RepID=UPI0035CA93C6